MEFMISREEMLRAFPHASEATLRRTCGPAVPHAPRTSRAVEVEGDLHDELEKHCRAQGYLILHSRMDMATSIAMGWPDFTVFMPDRRVCFLELKSKHGKVTTEQRAKIMHALKLGFVAAVVDNMPDALAKLAEAHE